MLVCLFLRRNKFYGSIGELLDVFNRYLVIIK